MGCGVSCGVLCNYFSKKSGTRGKVIAFEPLGENAAKIIKNIQLNGLKNVEVVEAALGKESGASTLYYFFDPSGKIIDNASSTLLKPKPGISFFEKPIIIVKADDFLEKHSIPQAVKIDVEGYEQEVIEGMKKVLSSPVCKLVLLEVHADALLPGRDCEVFEKLFYSFGFKNIKKVPNKETVHLICFK